MSDESGVSIQFAAALATALKEEAEKQHARADRAEATLAAIRKWAMEPTGVMLAAKYDVLALLDAKETP